MVATVKAMTTPSARRMSAAPISASEPSTPSRATGMPANVEYELVCTFVQPPPATGQGTAPPWWRSQVRKSPIASVAVAIATTTVRSLPVTTRRRP